ncbi:MAG: transaldolase [Anaerolineae bacterium]|nr:transaldolase [Anaerolineae bacterium]
MKFFLDSAIVEEVRHALELWNIDGVTTNPRHVQASGKPFLKVIQEIGAMVTGTDKTVSVQTNPASHDDYRAIVEEGRRLAKLSPNFVIKMPSTEHGFKACSILKQEGIRSNLTLCFSPTQGLQAMRMGAHFLSPFVGWKESNAEDTDQFVDDLVAIRDNFGFTTEILVAAVRTGRQITYAAVAGADIITASFAVYQDAFTHPYTDMGLKKFQEFWDKTPYE